MNPIFNIENINVNDQINIDYQKNIHDITKLFNEKWKKPLLPIIILINSKTQYEEILQSKHENWIAGNVNGSTIYMLHPDKIEKETEGFHKKEEFNQILKHEMMHVYTTFYSNFCFKPSWLFEGIAVYFADQIKTEISINKKFILNTYDHFEGDFYTESGIFVKYLINIYGFHRIKDLIKLSYKCNNVVEFQQLFYDIYKEEKDA